MRSFIRRLTTALFLLLYLFCSAFTSYASNFQNNLPPATAATGTSVTVEPNSLDNAVPPASGVPLPDIDAPACVLMDADTGLILYSKDPHQRLFPASTTKVMTALLTLEARENDLSHVVTFSQEAVNLPPDSSSVGMQAGETLTVDQALYALLLPSANEVANALAEDVAGSIDAFAQLMTDRAHELGAVDTHFANANGLHDDDHYTTPYDLALIFRQALQHPDFIRYISTKTYTLPPTNKQPDARPMANSNRMIKTGDKYYYEYCIGGKTGYTDQAGHTLVCYAVQGDTRLVGVVMNGNANIYFQDMINLFDYGFALPFQSHTYASTASFAHSIGVQDGATQALLGSVPLQLDADVTGRLPATLNTGDIKTEYDLPQFLSAPVKQGDQAGTVNFTLDGMLLASAPLYVGQDLASAPSPSATASPGASASPQASAVPGDATPPAGSGGGGFPIGLMALVVVAAVVIGLALRVLYVNRRRRRRRQRLSRDYQFRDYRSFRR